MEFYCLNCSFHLGAYPIRGVGSEMQIRIITRGYYYEQDKRRRSKIAGAS